MTPRAPVAVAAVNSTATIATAPKDERCVSVVNMVP